MFKSIFKVLFEIDFYLFREKLFLDLSWMGKLGKRIGKYQFSFEDFLFQRLALHLCIVWWQLSLVLSILHNSNSKKLFLFIFPGFARNGATFFYLSSFQFHCHIFSFRLSLYIIFQTLFLLHFTTFMFSVIVGGSQWEVYCFS